MAGLAIIAAAFIHRFPSTSLERADGRAERRPVPVRSAIDTPSAR
jgi:hypothetical protein